MPRTISPISKEKIETAIKSVYPEGITRWGIVKLTSSHNNTIKKIVQELLHENKIEIIKIKNGGEVYRWIQGSDWQTQQYFIKGDKK